MDLAKRGGRLSSKLFKGEGDIYGGGRISNFKSNGGSRGEGRRANFPKNEVSPLKSILGQNISTETVDVYWYRKMKSIALLHIDIFEGRVLKVKKKLTDVDRFFKKKYNDS